jgi:methylamine dehydrogenase light chain
MRNPIDSLVEQTARAVARRVSRRHFISGVGTWLFGAAAVPLLPVARGEPPRPGTDPGDPQSCDYWRHCSIDGYLCSCCGGSAHSCPPGTETAAVTWIGTCLNPGDGHHYIVSYNDCCGKGTCGRCQCNRNEGDKPLYVPFLSNDYNWCVGSQIGIAYHCTIARIIGLAK